MPSIAVMNAKGGVGKSTLTMAIAETLATFHGKSVLLIDADGQMSLSLMMMPIDRLNEIRAAHNSITGWIADSVLGTHQIDWRMRVTSAVSDVDDAKGLYLLAGDMDLALIEREITARGLIGQLREACRTLLVQAASHVDLVIVDCAPGISVMTECWLRECDHHLIPVKPDLLAVSGMEYLKRFRERDPGLGFAAHLGVVVNMKQAHSESDRLIHDLLHQKSELRCFHAAIPLIPHLQKAALFAREPRSYSNKYAGDAGRAIRDLTSEIVDRLTP